jgi:hypothetical protein
VTPIPHDDRSSILALLQSWATGQCLAPVVGLLEGAESNRREIIYIWSENKMKTILQRMVRNGILEPVPSTTRCTAKYRLATHKSIDQAERQAE